MAGRCGARYGDVAATLARIHERFAASLVEHRFSAVECDLRPSLDTIGWRGLLWIGILPALSIIYVRYFVKEPEVRVKNRPQQRAQKREVRVCYHQGAIFGGLVAPVLAFFAVNFNLGYAVPMLVGTVVADASVVISLLLSPETKGTVLVAELQVA
jgi:hypothetical protein